jgi:hypothetical protein
MELDEASITCSVCVLGHGPVLFSYSVYFYLNKHWYAHIDWRGFLKAMETGKE